MHFLIVCASANEDISESFEIERGTRAVSLRPYAACDLVPHKNVWVQSDGLQYYILPYYTLSWW